MTHYARFYHGRHDLLQFCVEGQRLLFELMISGKRGFILDGGEYDLQDHHIKLTLMLWIYCYASARQQGQPRDIFYISKTRADATTARNLFHGIGHWVVQDPEDVPAPHECLKQEKKATEKTLVGDCVVRFMSEDCKSVFSECLPCSEVVVLCDRCAPSWALTLAKKPGRYVYGVTLKREQKQKNPKVDESI